MWALANESTRQIEDRGLCGIAAPWFIDKLKWKEIAFGFPVKFCSKVTLLLRTLLQWQLGLRRPSLVQQFQNLLGKWQDRSLSPDLKENSCTPDSDISPVGGIVVLTLLCESPVSKRFLVFSVFED